jgi:putative methionine-R-sulfoxide reductase with GAF domain
LKVTLDNDRPSNDQTTLSARSQSVRSGLTRQDHLNGSLLVIAFLIIALGVFTVTLPIVSERLAAVWPWPKPQMLSLAVLCLALLTLAGLVHQRRYNAFLRADFERTQAEETSRSKKHTQRMFALLSVSRMLGSLSDIQRVFDAIVEMCIEAFSCHQASFMIFDASAQELVVRAAAGQSVPSTLVNARLKLGDGIAGWAAKHGQALLIGTDFDHTKYPELELKNDSLTSAMVVPIMLREELVGVLNVSTRSRKMTYDEDDLRALQVFAENVGSCIRHTEQASWMRETIRNLQETVKTQRRQAEEKPVPSTPRTSGR